MQIHSQPRTHHAHRIEDPRLIVKDELARQQVQNVAIRRPLNGPRTLHHLSLIHICTSALGRALCALSAIPRSGFSLSHVKDLLFLMIRPPDVISITHEIGH